MNSITSDCSTALDANRKHSTALVDATPMATLLKPIATNAFRNTNVALYTQ